MTDKVIKILKCSDPMMWYADKVGQTFPFIGVWWPEGFKTREESGYVNFVKYEDGLICSKAEVSALPENNPDISKIKVNLAKMLGMMRR